MTDENAAGSESEKTPGRRGGRGKDGSDSAAGDSGGTTASASAAGGAAEDGAAAEDAAEELGGAWSNIRRFSTWKRGFFMLLFAVLYGIAEFVVVAVAVFHFLYVLVAGERNPRLQRFGASLSQYIFEILRFETFNTERRPFPFEDWPEGAAADED